MWITLSPVLKMLVVTPIVLESVSTLPATNVCGSNTILLLKLSYLTTIVFSFFGFNLNDTLSFTIRPCVLAVDTVTLVLSALAVTTPSKLVLKLWYEFVPTFVK